MSLKEDLEELKGHIYQMRSWSLEVINKIDKILEKKEAK